MYGAHGAEALRKLRAHEWFEVLIVDPGLVLRLDDFLAFVSAEKLTDPWAARERYAAKLGKKRVYRGMAVTDEDRKSIEATGILSGALRGGTPPRPAHILDQLVGHLAGAAAPGEDTAISVSDDPEISKCVAHMFGRGDKAVHVWTLEMSPLDLVTADVNHPLCQPEPTPGSVACKRISYRKPYPPEVYPVFCRQFYDAKVESFVLYRIDPSEYVSSKAETEFASCKDAIAAVKKAQREAGSKYCNDIGP